ncbi:MAG: hypothetical protein L0H53_16965 [Candidatus Nitrosocosmicus sp.]|nr:hypothetical protein [Candidatus Nitrosocosmicus sp.]MDN5868457.1 hypothetical protein [Candidatus Nitrosocosmicus sp.]
MNRRNSLNKITVFFLISILGISTLQFSPLIESSFGQSENWYVGKGVKENTYYTFEIRDAATNQGQPFTMTIYFKEYNSTGQYWIAPTFVVDSGKVINGTLHLSSLDLTALGSSQIPPEMNEYRGSYDTTLTWLSSFAHKPGQSLSAPAWGKIASIGGPQIGPSGSAKVTTPAGTFDTTVISYSKGATSNIYVNSNTPFPIKAETYADVTYKPAPIQYTYQLIGTGTGQPPVPESQIEIPVPPFNLKTPRGTYNIQLLWEPVEIKADSSTNFGIIFTDARNNIVERVTYGYTVMDGNRTVIDEFKNQRANEGTGQFSYTFDSPGPKYLQITVESVTGETLGMFVEAVTFPLIVQ